MAYKRICGIYKIRNILNNKIYIGSSYNIFARWNQHKQGLNKNKHNNKHLQNAWNKYGVENFEFSIIEECEEINTLEREQFYLDKYKTFDKEYGYNISKSATAPMMGRKFSKETLLKLSESVKNRDSSCWVRGEDKYNTNFKEEDIIEIKRMIVEGNKIKDIAKYFKVQPNTITQIKTGERWSHIKTEYDELIQQNPRQKLTENEVIEIKKLLIENKLSIKEIANLYDLNFSNISAIKNLRTWKNVGIEYNKQLETRSYVNKLNRNKVIQIKKLLFQGKTCKEIADIYEVDRATINYIKLNKTWKDVIITENDLKEVV